MNASTRQVASVVSGCVAVGFFASPSLAQFPAVVAADDLDGTIGFTVIGYLYQEVGFSVAGVGDVNADGVNDFATGGPGCAFPNPPPHGCGDPTPGASYVIFGHPGIGGDGMWSMQDIDGSNGFRISGIDPNDGAGRVSPAGDFNKRRHRRFSHRRVRGKS